MVHPRPALQRRRPAHQAVDVTSVFQTGLVTSTAGLHSPKEELTATGPVATDKPMVVLVNGFSASASEIMTGALKDHKRATIIGTKTFGKGLVQSIIDLGNGAALKLTTAVYLTPNGTNINKKGITPDIIAKDKPKTKPDDALQRALRFIAAQKSSSPVSPRAAPGRTGRQGERGAGRRARPAAPVPRRPLGQVLVAGAPLRRHALLSRGQGRDAAEARRPRARRASHGDRRRIVEVLGGADDVKAVLRALLHAKGVRQGFSDAVLDEAAAVKAARRAPRPRPP